MKISLLPLIVSHLPVNLKNNLITEGRNNGAMLLEMDRSNHSSNSQSINKNT